MIRGHGGDIYGLACNIGCPTDDIIPNFARLSPGYGCPFSGTKKHMHVCRPMVKMEFRLWRNRLDHR
jgi:hypothetical protein